jgi:hypothetical protein
MEFRAQMAGRAGALLTAGHFYFSTSVLNIQGEKNGPSSKNRGNATAVVTHSVADN